MGKGPAWDDTLYDFMAFLVAIWMCIFTGFKDSVLYDCPLFTTVTYSTLF